MDDYTIELYQLLVRNEIQETEDQLVSRYIRGLWIQIQEMVNLFYPINVFVAH